MRKSKVLRKLRSGEWVLSIGTSFTASPRVTELAGLSGFDCLWIDMEHRPFDFGEVFSLLQGARAADTDCVVRIRNVTPSECFRPFEDGAAGIMVPGCRNAEEAERIIEYCKYPPLGKRGIDGVGADSDYGLVKADDYMRHANTETFVMIQIENRDALENVNEIAMVPGVDILFIGPGDLSSDLGIFGNTKGPVFRDAVKKTAGAAEKNGIWWGIPAGDTGTAAMYISMGARFINCGSDRGILAGGFKDMHDRFSRL